MKVFLSSALLLITLISPATAFAQTTATISGTPIKPLLSARDRLETRAANLASREAALKAKLQLFKDKIKAQRVQRISDNLNKINKLRTDQMTKHLEVLSTILTKLQTRVNDATASGSLSQVNQLISTAQGAIDTAKAGVDAQSQKDYTITVSSESTVKTDAMTQKDALQQDLNSTHDLVVAARKAVYDAIIAAIKAITGAS